MCEICDRADANDPTLWADWTDEDQKVAVGRGWDLFLVAGRSAETEDALGDGGIPYGHRPFELQALDEAERLDDQGAWIEVASGVRHGDRVARRALEFLQKYSLREYDAIVRLTGASLDANDNQPL